ncbi:DNA methyltransferase [Bradyrhizobium sp. JYMT SZCCT0180]|uniref:Eco57I restriction-modification methylase domain-containing protein n=1 Tax=Bradyrhizobium sp. JYMT SZCCT0180 TaxID=2807666 RepID=UPI001BAE3C54|nr:DNA methyltransferase [Bradyrhizobium sp. JYMT SZCCT0180]MBR1214601.1 hypothetical protein [Bradyrhizobium sp. JYMT SZCCT0180]
MSGPSVSRHHADWLSLVEVSGPFVSLPVLMRIFPQGLEPRDSAQAKALRAAYEEWQDNPAVPGSQRAWVIHVLIEVLGYAREQIAEGQALPAGLEAKVPEMGETLRPDFALVGPSGTDTAGQAQLLIANYPAGQDLDKPVIDRHWKATPATRMMELLHGTGVSLGLVTNGEQWTLVYAPRGETTGYAAWYGSLWLDEPITLRAFHSLLGVRRFFGVAADNTLLAMLKESASDQQEVTDQLGYQVREAVEVLVKSVDTLDRENHRALLRGLPETILYDAALTIMMRLVFLFAAEERGLLHLGKPLYDDNYAVSTLQEQLQETADQHGEEVLERRFDAWTRLLSTFRAVHGGIQHQDLLMLAYGGSLFDPDRYPFLEGRAPQSSWRTSAAEPLAVNNRIVLHLLNSLQRLQVRVPGGGPAESRRISFRALGVEQIGHVYEGLLDRTAVRASAPVLGIKGSRHKENDFSLAALESLFIQGRDKLLEFLKEKTGRSLSALKRAMDEGGLIDDHRLLIACGHDNELLERVRPFVNLIREDSFGRPLVTLTDSIYVTTTTTRRSTGTHYTPPSLTEPIVQHTLEPLVYEGSVEGWPREHWKLKLPKAILDLKVCDMAMGSGAFLVQACRYMSERLVEAWENLENDHPDEVLITAEGTFSTGSPRERLIPADTNERIAIARRVVADRCLYGVDINPMAVEMAKLSLWLVTLQRDRPFSFLDHALKCGDSLLGVTSLKEIDYFSLRSGERQVTFATANLSLYVEDSSTKRQILEKLPSNDRAQIEAKYRLHTEAEAATATIKALSDWLIALELNDLHGKAYEDQRIVVAERAEAAMKTSLLEFKARASEQLRGCRPFHWALEFPEVFSRGGFDAFVGNPPFMGGAKLETAFGRDYRAFIVARIANDVTGTRGTADIATYFLLRAERLTRKAGIFGLIVTNSLGQGDAKEVGLSQVLKRGHKIIRSVPSRRWPGTATVYYAMVWVYVGEWQGACYVDDEPVAHIDASMKAADSANAEPTKLRANEDIAFEGAKLSGEGFVVPSQKAQQLLESDPQNAQVLRPYLTGALLNGQSIQAPEDYVITFYDWPLYRESAPPEYDGPVASDFPHCLEWVGNHVRPQREKLPPTTAWNRKLRAAWWHFGQWRWALDEALTKVEKVLVLSRVTPHVMVDWAEKSWVFSDRLTVFATDDAAMFTLLQSSFHSVWAWRHGTTNLSLLSYSPAACFLTLPIPAHTTELRAIGERYYEHRRRTMRARDEGLTDIYNLFHNRSEESDDIARLRELHMEMDQSVAVAYGWSDLDLGHGFHETKQGIRFTISESAGRAVLGRLLLLNHERYAEEAAENTALAISAPVKRGRKKKITADKLTLDLL